MNLPSTRPTGTGGGPLYDNLLALGKATDVLVHNISGVTGAGTVGSPWTGWVATINACAANTVFNFAPGHYSTATTIAPGSAGKATGAGSQVSLVGLGEGVYIHYTGGGVAIDLDAYTAYGVGTRFYRMKLKNLIIEGNNTMVTGVRLANIFEFELDNITPYNFETSGSVSAGFQFIGFALSGLCSRLIVSNVTGLSGNMPAYGVWIGDRTYRSVTVGATGNVGITTGTNVITRASGSFVTDGVLVGNNVKTTGFANAVNNGQWRVIAVTALTITVNPGTKTFVTEAPFSGPVITTMTSTRVQLSATGNIGATSGTHTFSRASGSFITDGVLPGAYIYTGGFSNAGNNGRFQITAVAASTVTVAETLVTEAPAAGPTMNTFDVTSPMGTYGVQFDACDVEGCRKGGLWMQAGLGTKFTSSAFTTTAAGTGNFDWIIEQSCHQVVFECTDFENTIGIYIDAPDIKVISCTGTTNPVTLGANAIACTFLGGSSAGSGQSGAFTDNGFYNQIICMDGIHLSDIIGCGNYGYYHDRYDTSYPIRTYGMTLTGLQITDATSIANFVDVFGDCSGTAGAGAGAYVQTRTNRVGSTHTWRFGTNIGNLGGWQILHTQTGLYPIQISPTDDVVIGVSASSVGFYGSAGTAKPTVSGSRGANAALTSLLTALASQGLIINSSS